MQNSRPYVLSIAGLDPSAGAGLLADIKTFEALGVYGLGVCSALTIQTDRLFEKVDWVPAEQIIAQVRPLLHRFAVGFVKIGLIRGIAELNAVAKFLIKENPETKIIWDPILQASAGFQFQETWHQDELFDVLKNVFLITPNIPEILDMAPGNEPERAAAKLAEYCAVLLKGGHTGSAETVSDVLLNGRRHVFEGDRIEGPGKHGSGCVLSAAITARLALGDSLPDSCRNAKAYVQAFLQSGDGLLGYHSNSLRTTRHIASLQYITQDVPGISHAELAEAACKGGVRWVQLRLKNRPEKECIAIAKEVQSVCRRYDATLIINDHVGVAKEIRADGVHLGKLDLSPLEARKVLGEHAIIGATTNTVEDVERLEAMGVDYIGLGPYRFTSTKERLSPVLGLEGIARIAKAARVPVIAVGGIRCEDVAELMRAGVYGVAVASAINLASDRTAAAREFSPQSHKEHKDWKKWNH